MFELLQQAVQFVRTLFDRELSPKNCYHNIHHTEHVLERVTFLCENEQVTEEDKILLQTAAWFHDTGYTKRMMDTKI